MTHSSLLHYHFETVTPQTQIPTDGYDRWEICHITSGSGWVSSGKMQRRFHLNEVLLIPPKLSREFRFETGAGSRIRVLFHEAVIDKLVTILPKLKERMDNLRRHPCIISYLPHTADQILNTLRMMKSLQEEERISVLLKLLLRLSRTADNILFPSDRQAKKIIELIKLYVVHNANYKITLEDVAREANMSRYTFCTFFRKQTGMSFFTYLEEYRIGLACRLLHETDWPVSDICYKVGFNNIPHFNRSFKRVVGVSPKEYRKSEELHDSVFPHEADLPELGGAVPRISLEKMVEVGDVVEPGEETDLGDGQLPVR